MSNVSINKTGNVTIEGVGTQEQVVAATLVKRSVEGAISSGAITKADLQNPSALEKIKTAISSLNVGVDVEKLLSKVEVMFEIDLDTSQELLDHSSQELGIQSPQQIKGSEDLQKIGLVKNTISELKSELAGNKDELVIKTKIQEASSKLKELSSVNPELAKFIEKEIGTEVLDIMTNDDIPKALKMTTFKEIANNGFHLHNCAVGLLEQENNLPKETKYTKQLIDMATTSLESTGKNVESQVKFIKENSLLAKCLVGSETLANQPSAQLHPGAWGLFMLQPNKIEDVNAVTTKYEQDFAEVVRTNNPKARSEQDTSPISRLPPMTDGVHLYTTNGNNRRSFQRVIDGENVVTFSTKGNGLDLSVPKELLDISPDLKEMLEASKGGANSNDGKIHVFRFDSSKIDGHQTAGFADNRITDDFKNITDKQRILSGLSQHEDLFKPLEMALPKSLFVLGVAKTTSNLNKLPDTVKNWTNQGNNYVTQMVTSCEGETSLRLKRGANKDDTYRLGFVAQKELAGKNRELADTTLAKNNLIRVRNTIDEIRVLKTQVSEINPLEKTLILNNTSKIKENNSKIDTLENSLVSIGNEIKILEETGKETPLNILQQSRLNTLKKNLLSKGKEIETLRSDAIKLTTELRQIPNHSEKANILNTLQSKAIEVSNNLENTTLNNVINGDLDEISQHVTVKITQSQQKEASLGLEITALNQKIAQFDQIELAEFGTVLGKELTELEKNDHFQSDLRKISDNPTQNEKLALTMSYNLVGSLCLFIKDGDTSGNIGDSFESRNISNGSVRDEDEWGEGLIRKNGETIVCYASKDISDAANSLKSILDTVKVPQDSNLRGLITKTQTALTDFNTAFFGTQGSSDFAKISAIPDNIDRLLKNELKDNSNEIVARVVQSSEITKITQKLGINGNDREKFTALLETLKNPEGNPKSKENLATSNTILKAIYSNVAREFIGTKLMTSHISIQDSPDIFKMMFGSL